MKDNKIPSNKPRTYSLENEVTFDEIFHRLDNPLSIEEVLEKSNAETLEEVIEIVNGDQKIVSVRSVLGHLVQPGKLGIVKYEGSIQLISSGRWILPKLRSSLKMVVSFAENKIIFESLTIVRVLRGEIGFAIENGHPFLLGEGIHVKNNRLFQFIGTKSMNTPYLGHGSIHLIRVPVGFYALVIDNNVPKILKEGVYVTNSNLFEFKRFEKINQPYLSHINLHIFRVPKGMVALINENNQSKLLEGTHFINSKTLKFFSIESLTKPVIKNGTITRLVVRKGEVGLAWENNQPVFFEEGIYVKDSPFFSFEKTVAASEKQISIGPKKILTVYEGEVGVSYNKGKLVVLKPNRHFIDSAEHIFKEFLSTQLQREHLVSNNKKEFLICETQDFVSIGLKADVFYKIEDAEKVLLIVGRDNISTLVRETSIATLNSIIRSTTLSEVAQNKEIAAKSQKDHLEEISKNPDSASAPLFFDKVHEEFISKLYDYFLDQYGIAITNIRIESFRIMDSNLVDNISKQAFVTAQTETKLANLIGEREIVTSKQKRDAEVALIKAEGDAVSLSTEIKAKNKSILDTSKTEAEVSILLARAESNSIEIKALAEAKAILLRAESESKRAELLHSTQIGDQIQMYSMYSEMVKNSLAKVDKVVYLTTEGGKNPLSFWDFAEGNVPTLTLKRKAK
jgi:regulator of protease activity HflC (stomatin/prohibitin superfamily)